MTSTKYGAEKQMVEFVTKGLFRIILAILSASISLILWFLTLHLQNQERRTSALELAHRVLEERWNRSEVDRATISAKLDMILRLLEKHLERDVPSKDLARGQQSH